MYAARIAGEAREAPEAGEIFRQPDLAATLRKLVEAEQQALAAGKDRKDAIMAAYDRFYRGDIAEEFVRGSQEVGGLITQQDLANWKVQLEEPVHVNYKGIEVYKLTTWVQGPVMLQALNLLENFDLKSMGYNSARYIHTLYQAMNLAYADRDFYYGDPYFPPAEPIAGPAVQGLRPRAREAHRRRPQRPGHPPGRSLSVPGRDQSLHCDPRAVAQPACRPPTPTAMAEFDRTFRLGTTSVEAADEEGWVVSVTPSGGWLPAVIAGQDRHRHEPAHAELRARCAENPFNVVEPGKRPRATLTPTLALKDGKPFLPSPCRAATRRTRTCCSSSSTSSSSA